MSIFMSYIIMGLALSAPMGPINAAQLDKGVRFGFLHAWLVGVGAMVADGIYMLLIYFGISQLVDMPIIKLFLWIFGCFVLTYTGIEGVLRSGTLQSPSSRNQYEARGRAFGAGFLMSISNPLSILFWLGIYGSILAQTSSEYGASETLYYSMGIFLGITLWDVTMAGIATGARKLVNPQLLRLISLTTSLILVGFGVYFGVQVYRLLFG